MNLPALNAVLNSLSCFFLISGFLFIRRGDPKKHAFCMLSASVTSALFLVSYLYYHAHHGTTHFPGGGWVRMLYFSILLTHTILAAVQVPLIVMTLRWALRNEISRHKKMARVTFPIWLYVSITGVIIYFMLYQISYKHI